MFLDFSELELPKDEVQKFSVSQTSLTYLRNNNNQRVRIDSFFCVALLRR